MILLQHSDSLVQHSASAQIVARVVKVTTVDRVSPASPGIFGGVIRVPLKLLLERPRFIGRVFDSLSLRRGQIGHNPLA